MLFLLNLDEHVSNVLLVIVNRVFCNYRACEYFGGVWTIHTFWQPNIWPFAGPHTCHREGSSWRLHTGTVTTHVSYQLSHQANISLSSNILFFFSSWGHLWIPNMSKLRYVWRPCWVIIISLWISTCKYEWEDFSSQLRYFFLNRKPRWPRHLRPFSQDVWKV